LEKRTVVNDIQGIPQAKVEAKLEAMLETRIIGTSSNDELLVNESNEFCPILFFQKRLRSFRESSKGAAGLEDTSLCT